MKKSAYSEKLLDPRWQKKRLEVFERDVFSCRECNADDKTLQVHHLYYVSGREPWDYPLGAFLTVCVDCHRKLRAKGASVAEWEVFVELENDFNCGRTEFIHSLLSYAHEIGFPPVEVLCSLGRAMQTGQISSEQLVAWNKASMQKEKEMAL